MSTPSRAAGGDANAAVTQEALLATVREVSLELRPQDRDRLQVGLDSTLDGDLGLDSLARVELLLRIERRFGVALPEQALVGSETVRDVLQAVLAGHSREGGGPSAEFSARAQEAAPEQADTPPDSTRTLVEVLEWHLRAHPDRTHLHLYGEGDEPESITYASLAQGARRLAAGLLERGVGHGDSVAIMLPTGVEYFHSFLGTLLAGAVPVPIYPPARPSQIEYHVRQHAAILDNAGARLLISFPEARSVARLLRTHASGIASIETVADLSAAAPAQEALLPGAPGPEDTAFIQYTSGSTGRPKGVVLTHRNILSSLRAMGRALEVGSTDVFVSWLPLYHDMGLIGAWMGSLYYAFPLVLMSPLRFLSNPARWLWAIHAHRGTMSGGPNFAYELCLRRVDDAAIEGLDLSSWRFAFNGAEPVSPDTLERFAERFARFGLAAGAMAPVYGLAEATLGVAFTPRGRGPRIDRIRRSVLAREGRAEPVTAEEESGDVQRVVSCGTPLPVLEVRVVDTTGHEAPDRTEGRLEFKGEPCTAGYHGNPGATRELFHGDWLDSGDRAYIAEGEIFITSRSKDVIIRAGRNIYPYELEQAIGDVPGIRRGCVAVFGSTGAGTGAERLVVVAETRENDASVRAKLRDRIQTLSAQIVGTPSDDVVLAPPYTVSKTSSGKIRRPVIRGLYEQGRLGHAQRAPWLQVLRLTLAGVVPQLRRLRGGARDVAYAAWVWLLFAVISPLTWFVVVVLPRRAWCWGAMRLCGRLLLGLSGTRLVIDGSANLPAAGSYVLVANHSSYLDGLVLTMALRRPLAYVVKRELAGQLIPRLFLERLGVLFVERFDRRRGVEDSRRIAGVLRAGTPLGYFPEGTFRRMPGLLPFHMGAFLAAAEAGAPVVPVALRGTRSILRDDEFFPRRGTVHVHVGSPIHPPAPEPGSGESHWNAALRLRDAARAEILAFCGEPDLAGAGSVQ